MAISGYATVEEALEVLKLSLGTTIVMSDVDLIINLKKVQQKILSYCNIGNIPNELLYIWAEITEDLVRYLDTIKKNATAEGLDQFKMTDVSKIRVGDTDIALGGSDSASNKIAQAHTLTVIDGFIYNYKTYLHRYRRMVH